MTDEVPNSGVELEVANPETSQQSSAEVQPLEAPKESRHFANLRRQNEELAQKVKLQDELMHRMLAQQPVYQTPQPVEEPISISDDDYIQGSQFKKLRERDREDLKKELMQEIQKKEIEQEKMRFRERLKSQFSDFDDIVNSETLAILQDEDPSLAQTIANTNDPYTIGLQSYKYIKALGLAAKAPVARRAKEVDKALEDNARKVQSPQAYDKRPVVQAYEMTKEQSSALYNEMKRYSAMSGGAY